MRCRQRDCFAFDIRESNSCSALTETKGCKFYKTREQLRRQKEALIEKGKPYYEAARTAADNVALAKLLKGGDDDGDMDQVEPEDT